MVGGDNGNRNGDRNEGFIFWRGYGMEVLKHTKKKIIHILEIHFKMSEITWNLKSNLFNIFPRNYMPASQHWQDHTNVKSPGTSPIMSILNCPIHKYMYLNISQNITNKNHVRTIYHIIIF